MRRLYAYPKVPKWVWTGIKYGSLIFSLFVFWIVVLFHSQIKFYTKAFFKDFFTPSKQAKPECIAGPYSDALAKNFIKLSENKR